MMECGQCRRSADESDRFCSQCGTSLLPGTAPFKAKSATTSEAVTRSPARWIAGLAGLGLVGLLLFSVTRAVEGESSANGSAATPTTPIRPVAPDDQPDYEFVAGDGPLFGQPVGLWLYVGSESGLTRIDLDSGDRTNLAVRGFPRQVTGRWLVITEEFGGWVEAVDLDDPAAAAVQLGLAFQSAYGPMAVAEPGQIWLFNQTTDERFQWQLIDIAGGDLVETVDAPHPFTQEVEGSTLMSVAGGIFERTGNDYRRVLEGVLLAASEQTALVRTCDGPTTCDLRWFDPVSWTELDLPLPDTEIDRGAELSRNGRLLAFFSGGRLHIFDIETGQVQIVDAEAFALAPDGRFFAVGSNDHVDLHAVDTEGFRRFDLPAVSAQGLLFVEHG